MDKSILLIFLMLYNDSMNASGVPLNRYAHSVTFESEFLDLSGFQCMAFSGVCVSPHHCFGAPPLEGSCPAGRSRRRLVCCDKNKVRTHFQRKVGFEVHHGNYYMPNS